ncbi:phospholipid scramblase 2-like [Colias croceus]|uniref:phospholipid scramblase 2-like n=1 Tax=Colias crocea TaxID=72248 RepID=UPI001E27C317|nr:phospholipid scramblase 2-like [Colias croceus]
MQTKNLEPKEEWMTCPNIETDFPGLAYLCDLNKLVVAKKSDALHHLFGDIHGGYTIYNGEGQKVFLAVEKKVKKKIEIKIYNFYGNEVINLEKPGEYCISRFLICSPPGQFIGSVRKIKCLRKFYIKNAQGEIILTMKPRGIFCIYDIFREDVKIGNVVKKKCVRNAENNDINIVFPMEMSVEHKSILLGACFLTR